ncbi:MAG TPA: LPS export ABC transporter permease LptF [Nitrospirota bacterium]|nr:LPS export ABC transporter permease LptF [Nitrospirota bacterium]
MTNAKILDRYIFREMLPPFFLSVTVLLLVLFLNKIFRLADLVISKGASLLSILQVFAYVLPSFMVITIPMSLVIASLTTFARLSSDSEVTAMKASCISLYSMIRPVFFFATICFILTAVTSLMLVPGADAALKAHLFNMVKSRAMVGIEPGVFTNTFDGMVIYVDKMQSLDKLEGIFIYDERSAKEPYAVVAKSGKLIADPQSLNVTLDMQEGSIHTQPRDEHTYTLMRFESGQLFLDINNALIQKGAPRKSYQDFGTVELIQEIGRLRQEGQPTYPPDTELHKRLSIPFACLILGLIGAPLGIRRSRSGKSAGVAVALLVFLAYYIILGSATNLAETGTVLPIVAFWVPNLMMILVAIVYVLKAGREINFMIINKISILYYRVKNIIYKHGKF